MVDLGYRASLASQTYTSRELVKGALNETVENIVIRWEYPDEGRVVRKYFKLSHNNNLVLTQNLRAACF